MGVVIAGGPLASLMCPQLCPVPKGSDLVASLALPCLGAFTVLSGGAVGRWARMWGDVKCGEASDPDIG